ncbi:MAG: serine/threonine protein kinase, partial [Pseudonocardiaceae bacterium]
AEEVARWRERWADQAELLGFIRHPGVVGVHAHFEGAQMHLPGQAVPTVRALYLVMNWVGGQDLREWVPQHTRPEDRGAALQHLVQIAEVLDYLHSGHATTSGRPVVHGDISPANVIINPDGQAVLVDFGLFRMVRHITAVPAGTQGYCAPEVLRGGEYSPASDRYAFGGLAYYTLTGTHPPADPQQLLGGLATIAEFTDQQASVRDLAKIFADDPDTRPSAGEWIRNLRMQSSTALRGPSSPLPPPAPPGAAAFHTSERGLTRRVPIWAAVTTGASVLTVALLIVALTVMPGTAEPGSTPDNRTPIQPSTAPTRTQTPPTSDRPTEDPVEAPAPNDALTPGEWLVDVDPVEGGDDWERGPRNVNGRTYARSLYHRASCDDSMAGYDLGRRHTRLQATIGKADDAPSDSVTRFIVQLDGRAALTRDLRVGQQAAVDLDVTDVLRLTLRVEQDGSYYSCSDGDGAVWADARLFR